MRLKKKLAEDFIIKEMGFWNEAMDGALYDHYSQIYIAGFEKAREMAQEAWQRCDTTFGHFDCTQMGEEEVE